MNHNVSKLKDEYYDIPLNELNGIIAEIKEEEDTELLIVAKATMLINPEWHSMNCVGKYDVTDIIRRHKTLALYKVAKDNTISHSRVTVDIVVEWVESEVQ